MKRLWIVLAFCALNLNADKLVNLQIDGMTCVSCVGHVKSTLAEVKGVKESTVYVKEGKVQVKSAESTKPESLCDAMKKSGYGCQIVK